MTHNAKCFLGSHCYHTRDDLDCEAWKWKNLIQVCCRCGEKGQRVQRVPEWGRLVA